MLHCSLHSKFTAHAAHAPFSIGSGCRVRASQVACAFSPATAMASDEKSNKDSEPQRTSAVQPRAGCLHLQELNQRSANIGKWDVGIFHPRIETWAPANKSPGAAFRCMLVSSCDPSKYMAAEWPMCDKNRELLNRAEQKFKANSSFCMSKVVLNTKSKQEYLHTSLKQVVLLNKCHMDPLLQTGEDSVQPQPSMTLKDLTKLTQSCRFDITALVLSVGSPRLVNRTHKVVDLRLMDESGPGGKVQIVPLNFFYNDQPQQGERATVDTLLTSTGNGSFSFFALQATQTDNGYVIESSKDCFLLRAVGARAESLTARQDELQKKAGANEADVLEMAPYRGGRNWTEEQGKETFAKILTGLNSIKNIEALEDQHATLWQLNWVEIAWPMEERITTKNGDRLFFKTVIRDISGSMNDVWMTEEAALALARLNSKDDFIQAYNAGKKLFPVAASVKVTRQLQKSDDDGSQVASQGGSQGSDGSHLAAQDGHRFNFTIVHAADQSLNEGPTQATLVLLPLLDDLKPDTSSMLPAALHMVETSPHYTFEVLHSECNAMPCQKIIALIRCSKDSVPEQLKGGFKLTTTGVADLLVADDSEHVSKRYTVSAICTMENLPNYRLDPPRGGEQHALVTISDKIGDTFVLDQVQLLSQEEANQAAASMRRLLSVAIEVHKPARKRGGAWTEEFSPAIAKKCRVLGRSPTDAAVPAVS